MNILKFLFLIFVTHAFYSELNATKSTTSLYFENGKPRSIESSAFSDKKEYIKIDEFEFNSLGYDRFRIFIYVTKNDFNDNKKYTSFIDTKSRLYVVCKTKINGNYKTYDKVFIEPKVTSYISGYIEFPVIGEEV